MFASRNCLSTYNTSLVGLFFDYNVCLCIMYIDSVINMLKLFQSKNLIPTFNNSCNIEIMPENLHIYDFISNSEFIH